MCPQERLVIISRTTGLSFVLKRIGPPLAAIIITLFYLLALYLLVTIKTHKNLSVRICTIHRDLAYFYVQVRYTFPSCSYGSIPYFHIERCYSDPLLLGVINDEI